MLGFQPKLIVIGPNQGIGSRQRGGDTERAVGEGGGVADAGGPLRAQRGPSGLPQRPLRQDLTTTSGDVTLHIPRLKGVSFETAIIERYRRRESSVEEALIEMYLAGVSVRRVEDITEALWGSKVSPATISELNKKAYVHIEDWRNRSLQGGHYPYVYVDGIYLRRNWGGEYENVSGNVKKCAVGKHPKSEKHGNTAQFSEVERSGTQENCGGIGSGCRLRATAVRKWRVPS